MSYEFLCTACSKMGTRCAAHKCSQCDLNTETEYAHCFACAFEKDICQRCSEPMQSNRNPSGLPRIAVAREIHTSELVAAKIIFEKAIEPIEDAVAKWEDDKKSALAVFNNSCISQKREMDTAAEVLTAIRSSGLSTTAAQEAFDTAKENFDSAQRRAKNALAARLQEIDVEFSSYRETYQNARRTYDDTERLANQRFGIEMQRLYSLWQVEVKYQNALKALAS